MNDDKEQAGNRENSSDLQSCCDGGSCCPSGSDGGDRNWKIAVFVLIMIAAGAVLARSIIRKSNSATEQGQDSFATIQPDIRFDTPSPSSSEDLTASKDNTEIPTLTNEKTEEDVSGKTSSALWKPELETLASLNKVAADADAVFILLVADDLESNQAATQQIEAAAKRIHTGGTRVSAFRLKQGAPNYENLTEQLSVPCVLAMVKGGGVSGVSTDKITETKLVQAFVAASRPSSDCCPGGTCCPTK